MVFYIRHDLDERCPGTYPPTCTFCEQFVFDMWPMESIGCKKGRWHLRRVLQGADWRKLMLTAVTCEDFEEVKDAQSTGD